MYQIFKLCKNNLGKMILGLLKRSELKNTDTISPKSYYKSTEYEEATCCFTIHMAVHILLFPVF
jgi:hypothetical protein